MTPTQCSYSIVKNARMGFPPPKQRETESADSCTNCERVVRVSVKIHSVASSAIVKGASGNFPVAIILNLFLDVAHRSTKVLNTISAKCLLGSNVVASGEVIHYSLLFCVNFAHNYELLKLNATLVEKELSAVASHLFLNCYTSSIP